jgi:hypothetical protein
VQKSYLNRVLFVGKFTLQLVLNPNYLFLVDVEEFKGILKVWGRYGSLFDYLGNKNSD